MGAHIPEAASLSGRLAKSKFAGFLSHSWKPGGLDCGDSLHTDLGQTELRNRSPLESALRSLDFVLWSLVSA